MTIQFDPDAQAELFAISDYYEGRRPGYGNQLITAVETAARAAAVTPTAGPLWPGTTLDTPIRRRRVPGFPSIWLAYVVVDKGLYILAIVHTSRDHGYWTERIERYYR